MKLRIKALLATLLLSAAPTAAGQSLPFVDMPSAVAGGTATVRIKGLPGQGYVLWFAPIEELTQITDEITMLINPIRALIYGLQIEGALDGNGLAQHSIETGVEWAGDMMSFQAITYDEKSFAISNLARATWQLPNTFAETVGTPTAFSILGDLFPQADGRIIAIGGAGPLVQAYEPWLQQTLPAGLLPTGYLFSSRVQLANGTILIVGGLTATAGTDGKGNPTFAINTTNEAFIYNPTTGDTVAAKGSLNTARAGAAAARLNNGKVFIFGGIGTIDIADPASLLTGVLSSSEIYDPATDSFTNGPALAEGKAFHTCTILDNGRVLVAGGLGLAFGIPLISNTAYEYNPTNNTFGFLPKFFTGARMFHTATKLNNGRVVLAGGLTADLTGVIESGDLTQIVLGAVATTAVYNPSGLGTFAAGPVLPAGRALHAAAVLPGTARMLLAGGLSGDIALGSLLNGDIEGVLLPSVVGTSDILSLGPPATVVAGPDLITPRAGASAAVVPMDGRILIFGGGPLQAELYQP